MQTALSGLRILVVEDEAMVGIVIEDILLDEGCRIVGPYLAYEAALAAAQTELADLAILDVNLAGRMSFPIGEVLASRGIPFVLLSGYGGDAAPAEHPEWPTCSKPFTPEALIAALRLLAPSDAT